ncbi:MAG: hypothetical protein ACRD3M_00260 [Thermoanaerobaculia bacterium]
MTQKETLKRKRKPRRHGYRGYGSGIGKGPGYGGTVHWGRGFAGVEYLGAGGSGLPEAGILAYLKEKAPRP